jgi:DDE superfamily endonuclease
LITISANGICLPPYVIYKSKHLYDTWCPKNVIRGAMFNRTYSGWIDEDRFYDYFKNLFIPQTKHVQRPLLLIVDGHTSHLSIKTAQLAIENEIHMVCLPAHATHLLQPLDVYTLKYVKTQWRNLLWNYNKKNSSKRLDKPNFIRLYAELYNYAFLPNHCSSAFGKAGIFPYDPRVIKRNRLVKACSNQTSSTSLLRSNSIEFNYNDIGLNNETNVDRSNISIASGRISNQCRRLVKYPSDPVLIMSKW